MSQSLLIKTDMPVFETGARKMQLPLLAYEDHDWSINGPFSGGHPRLYVQNLSVFGT